MLLSVLIPTRNRGIYLKTAIESALAIVEIDIEIIVSENHSSDNSLAIARSFSDSRLKVIRPDYPLAMHENFEYVLSHSKGNWVTFLGDDDAIMPHAASWLRFLSDKHPEAEIISSERATYQWPGLFNTSGGYELKISPTIEWRDSKLSLTRCINGHIDYTVLPQMYSGGFFKRSLIRRIYSKGEGLFFLSAVPDAFTCAAGLIHTFRYIYTGIPMVWTGASPSSDGNQTESNSKNRKSDYIDTMSDDSIRLNLALGSDLLAWPFTFHFLDAYLVASSSHLEVLNLVFLKRLTTRAVVSLLRKGTPMHALALCKTLGVKYPGRIRRLFCRMVMKTEYYYYALRELLSKKQLNPRGVLISRAESYHRQESFESIAPLEIYHIQASMQGTIDRYISLSRQLLKGQVQVPTSLVYPPWDPRSFS